MPTGLFAKLRSLDFIKQTGEALGNSEKTTDIFLLGLTHGELREARIECRHTS